MKQSKITITDRFIYGYINSYTINNKPVFASNKHIAEKIERSESVVSHSISRLLSNGFLINKGNKYARQLYTNIELTNADFNSSIAENNKSNAENSISLEEFKRVIAENSNNEKLKTAIANAENSNILYKILISYTNIKENKYDYSSMFEEWYFKYPNKKSKGTAEKSFIKILKDKVATYEQLVNGLNGYIKHITQSKTEKQFIKHPSTWLNQKCWLDEHETETYKSITSGYLTPLSECK